MQPNLSDFIELYRPESILPAQKNVRAAIYRARFFTENYCDALFELSGVAFPVFSEKAAVKRKAEYLAGRIVAGRALNALGKSDFNLKSGGHREPLWPAGVIGSISHSSNQAIAVALDAGQTDAGGIGVDVEAVMSPQLAQGIAAQILSAEERKLLSRGNLEFAFALTIAFSAKESLFKTLFPAVGDYMDFSDAELIVIDEEQNAFTLALTDPYRLSLLPTNVFYGRYLVRNQEIITVVTL